MIKVHFFPFISLQLLIDFIFYANVSLKQVGFPPKN